MRATYFANSSAQEERNPNFPQTIKSLILWQKFCFKSKRQSESGNWSWAANYELELGTKVSEYFITSPSGLSS